MPYNASQETTVAKPIGANGMPDGARSYFHDIPNFTWRPYVSTAEVLSYLTTAANRRGHFLIIVNSGGTLANGVITGGVNTPWWFKDGVGDGNLVPFIPTPTVSTGKEVFKVEQLVGDGSPGTPLDGAVLIQNGNLIGKEVIDFVLGAGNIPLIPVANGMTYAIFDPTIGRITLSAGSFTQDDYIKITYK